MAPRKPKTQGKRNNLKIKSKVIPQKRGIKPLKKVKASEKPLDNLKWLNKIPNNRAVKKCSGVPAWLNSGGYKHSGLRRVSEDNISDYGEYPPKDAEDKSTLSDGSDECNCAHPKYPENKAGILKRKSSSTTSLVAKYIKSGMDHVASFIVESAIRFGEQHGVVIPDKNTPNVYEITPPDKFDEKCRKIRFKIPEKNLGYEKTKKMMWRNHGKNPKTTCLRPAPSSNAWKAEQIEKTASRESNADSLEEILPLLEKLKDGEEVIQSDLDLNKLNCEAQEKRTLERERGRERERVRDLDRNIMEKERNADRGRSMDRERERERERGRNRERLREKFRALGKRYKSVGAMSGKVSEENQYLPAETNPWKKFRRDSVELGRQRLRASTCPRKPGSRSPSPY